MVSLAADTFVNRVREPRSYTAFSSDGQASLAAGSSLHSAKPFWKQQLLDALT